MPNDASPSGPPANRLRSLWFESRHLETGAPALQRDLAALDDEARAFVLARGDRIAATSLTLAQQYCRHAPTAWGLGRDAFVRWVERGEALATGATGSREAALAYFALDPLALAAVPDGDLDAWLVLAQRVIATSQRLGEIFVAESGAILAELPARRARLDAWVGVGLALSEPAGWETESLALRFFGATSLALPLLVADDFRLWAELGRAALRLGMARSEFFTSAPTALHRLSESNRSTLLQLACTASAQAPAVALETYFSLPAVLDAFPSDAPLITASLAPVARHVPAALADLLPVLRAILFETPGELRTPLAALAVDVAERFPEGVVPFYRVLLRLLDHTGLAGIEAWVSEGLGIAADNPDAGRAYFALDSRTSRTVLDAGSTAVAFSEVQGLVKRYLQMLTGQTWQVAARDDIGYRPPFDAAVAAGDDNGARAVPPTLDGMSCRGGAGTTTGSEASAGHDAPRAPGSAAAAPLALFPPRIDLFPTAEANLRLYRLIAAQHAGRLEFESGRVEPTLTDFLAGFEHADVAEEIFGIFEGVRIDAALARAYRGLAADLRAVAIETARASIRLPGTVDHLGRALVRARRPDLARLLPALAERLAAPDARAPESARATRLIYDAVIGDADRLSRALDADGLAELSAERLFAEGMSLEGGAGPLGDPDEEAPVDGDASGSDDTADTSLAIELRPELDASVPGQPVDPAELARLLKEGHEFSARQGTSDDLEALGLYVTDLAGKLPRERIAELQGRLRQAGAGRAAAPSPAGSEGHFVYDEWDHAIGDYRSSWCQLTEIPLESDTGDFFHRTLAAHADLLPEVRRQFQRIRPERYRVVHGLEDGEDFDLDAVIDARADRRSGRPPSPKLYQARQREERDVATLFLLDMSASTDEAVPGSVAGRRVIDVIKEALVVMTEALEEIGDTYGIYGFSGHGRNAVEFYLVKQFTEALTGAVKGRVGAIEPKRSTRMGAAVRHAVAKIRGVHARSKHVLLLSDGFPQDLDYGDDRRSNTYGIQDTMMAFQEAVRAGVTPFCITVDRAGHDYLKEICEAQRYLVIEDLTALPRELPKIYQRFVRP